MEKRQPRHPITRFKNRIRRKFSILFVIHLTLGMQDIQETGHRLSIFYKPKMNYKRQTGETKK